MKFSTLPMMPTCFVTTGYIHRLMTGPLFKRCASCITIGNTEESANIPIRNTLLIYILKFFRCRPAIVIAANTGISPVIPTHTEELYENPTRTPIITHNIGSNERLSSNRTKHNMARQARTAPNICWGTHALCSIQVSRLGCCIKIR